jgi:hypothetical protein
MARAALEPQQQTPSSRKKRARFASFDVPAGSRVISATRVQKNLDEDGIV